MSKLQRSPIQITLRSAKTIERIATAAKDPKLKAEFPPIKVALFKNSMYIVDGHTIMEGFRLAGLDTILAMLYQVESLSDVLALHVKFNQHSPLNPFELIDLINYMAERGENPEQIRQRLQLGEHLTRLVGCHIANNEAKNKLKSFAHDLSVRYSNAVIPPYFAELVSRIPEKIQLDVVEQFIAIIGHAMSDRKFAFPGPETLDVYFRQYLKNKEREPVFFRQEPTPPTTKTARAPPPQPIGPEERRKAKDLVGTVSGMAILKVDRPGLYRVNMIKKIISPIKDEKGLTVIQGDEGCRIFSLPPRAAEFLRLVDDDTSDVFVRTFNVLQMKRFVSRLSDKKARFVVIFSPRS
ncbi:MAG: hypothetical protein WAO91_00815 [Candidatus Nitrosotenuis sp.]